MGKILIINVFKSFFIKIARLFSVAKKYDFMLVVSDCFMGSCVKFFIILNTAFLAVLATPINAQDTPYLPSDYVESTLPGDMPEIQNLNPIADTPQETPNTPMEITADGDVSYDQLTGLATAQRNVMIKYQGATLFADEVTYDKTSGTATANGNAFLYSKGKEWHGDAIIYNFNTKEITSSNFKGITGHDYANSAQPAQEDIVMFLEGKDVTTTTNGSYQVTDTLLSLNDNEKPDTRIQAKSVELYPNDRVVMRDVTFYAGNVPVFYLPYYSQGLKDRRMPFYVKPGYSSKLGAMLTVGYNWSLNPYIQGNLYVTGYSKRGIGGGSDFSINYGKNKEYGEGLYKLYGIGDKLSDDSFAGTARSGVPYFRYIAAIKQRNYFSNNHNLSFSANLNKWSDPYVTEDFFQREFAKEVQPDNTLDLNYYDPNYTAGVMSRLQVNDFFQTVERLPEGYFNLKRQRIFGTRLMYQTETTFSYLKQAFANQSQNYNALLPTQNNFSIPDYEAGRLDTYHQIIYPVLVAGWLNLTPRVGARGTYYSDTPIVGSPTYASSGNDALRGVFNTGMEASFKIHKTWSDINNEKWEIDGLRHVMIPSANFAYIPKPNYTPGQLYQFDYQLPSTQLAPIDFPQYNSVDTINKQNVVRLGVRNKIQTQRSSTKTTKDKRTLDLLDWNLYADAYISAPEPNYWNYDQFSDIFNDIIIRPTRWWTTAINVRNSTKNGDLNEFNTSTSFQVAGNFESFFNTRFLANNPYFPSGNQFGPGFKYRVNEDWSVGGYWLYEADQSILQYQEYSLSRDWPSWVTSLTFQQVRNVGGPNDNRILLIFTLKAFPEITLKTNVDAAAATGGGNSSNGNSNGSFY